MLTILFIHLYFNFVHGSVLRLDTEHVGAHVQPNTTVEAANGFRTALNEFPFQNADELSNKFHGDILLSKEEILLLFCEDQPQENLNEECIGRNAYIAPGKIWPNGEVAYEVLPNFFNESQLLAIFSAMEAIQKNTCVRFRPANPADKYKVKISGHGDGCYSNVGFSTDRSENRMNLAPSILGRGCFVHGIIVHELLHVLGLFHQQSTWDRDNYVKISFDNIKDDMAFNFDKLTSKQVSNLGTLYDYGSVMHYGLFAFTKNGKATIKPSYPYVGYIGQRVEGSPTDFLKINRLYRCPGAWEGFFPAPTCVKQVPLSPDGNPQNLPLCPQVPESFQSVRYKCW